MSYKRPVTIGKASIIPGASPSQMNLLFESFSVRASAPKPAALPALPHVRGVRPFRPRYRQPLSPVFVDSCALLCPVVSAAVCVPSGAL